MKKRILAAFAAAAICLTPKAWATGELLGIFSVSATKKVQFSQGNLQAVFASAGNSCTWQFAANQYDYVGYAAANNSITGNGSVSAAGIVDLFGWSTAATYYGINNSSDANDYGGDFVDWGNLAISNGGNTENSGWRTLTRDEWAYLFSNHTFGFATVAGVNGVIIAPDNYAGPAIDSNHRNGQDSFANNTIDVSTWQSTYVPAGVVFLPAAGFRLPWIGQVQENGYYWSSSAVGGDSNNRFAILLGLVNAEFQINVAGGGNWPANDGFSVRLVKNIYTISYDANGGSGAPSEQMKYHGIDLTLSSTVPTCEGYPFAGWNTAADGSGASYEAGATFTPNADTTLYAQWMDAYEAWAAENDITGAWDETSDGVHNVFRYVFGQPTGAFTNPPLIDIAIDGGNAVVITPPVSNTVGFTISVVESSDVAGAAVTRRKPLDATGRTEFPMGSVASRFYRLSATEGDAESDLGVQLWENGPYWAECNVGASAPEDFGYYFWWGDTVGYTRSGGTKNLFGLYTSVTWGSSTGEQMGSSPFDLSSCPTYGKDNSELLAEGWIDATGNLVAAHDAATAHLGAPWRMPTDAEFAALTNNCIATWITTNGVSGRLVTGTGAYADRSIFLPAPGYGSGTSFGNPNLRGYYWSSTPDSDNSYKAWYLDFNSSLFQRDTYYGRQYGLSVRPVRDAE